MAKSSTSSDSINYNPTSMDNVIRYLNSSLSSCENAKQFYDRSVSAISAVESAGYSLPAGGKSLLEQAIGELQTLLSDANKIKNKFLEDQPDSEIDNNGGGTGFSLFDWDGDGESFEWFNDLAQLNYNATVNNPYAGLDVSTSIPITPEAARNLVSGDLDGDGESFEWFNDLAQLNYNATVNNPYAGLDASTSIPITPEAARNLVSGDWDGDGESFEWFKDLAQLNYNATVNNPYAGLDASTSIPITPEAARNFVSGDWDGDGKSWELNNSIKDFDYVDYYGTEDGLGYILEFITDKDYRSTVVEDLVDLDNNGVRDYVEFANHMADFDYNEFYGNQTFVTDAGIPISGEFLNFVADPFAGVLEFTGDVATDAVIDPRDAVNRVVASGGNLAVGLSEGIVDWGEAVFDTALMINSYSVYADMQAQSYQYDMYSNLFGNDIYSHHADMLRNSSESIVLSSAEIADREYKDIWFDSLYETDFFSGMNDLAYSATKRGVGPDGKNGILYNVAESVGYNLPTMALTHGATAYGGTNLLKSTFQAFFTWAPSFGKNFEKKYGGVETIAGVNDAMFKAGTSATVDSLIVYLAGKIPKLEITKVESIPFTDFYDDLGYSVLPSYGKVNLWESLGINPTDLSIAIKMLKPVINEVIDTKTYGDEFTWSFDENGESDALNVIVDMVGILIAEEIANYSGGFYQTIKPANSVQSALLPPTENTHSAEYYKWLNGFLKDVYKRVGKEGASDLYEDGFIDYLFEFLGDD